MILFYSIIAIIIIKQASELSEGSGNILNIYIYDWIFFPVDIRILRTVLDFRVFIVRFPVLVFVLNFIEWNLKQQLNKFFFFCCYCYSIRPTVWSIQVD